MQNAQKGQVTDVVLKQAAPPRSPETWIAAINISAEKSDELRTKAKAAGFRTPQAFLKDFLTKEFG